MRFLKSALLPSVAVAGLFPGALNAQLQVNGPRSEPIITSQSGDVTITEDGEVTVATGAAITVDSSNDVSNEGQIETGEDNGAVGILIKPNVSAAIENSGDILVEEDFVGEDDDENGVADGPIARATGRYGILVEGGGTFTGTIENEGDILVEGLSSGGIVLNSDLVGDLVHTGEISVIGDASVGVSTRNVTGDVQLRGGVSVAGRGSSAYISDGVIDGTLVVQGTLSQSTAYANDDDSSISFSRADLRAGNPSVWIRDDITGGIVVAVAPDDDISNNDDEDADGFDDDDEGSGAIIGYGAAPALLIDGTDPIVIGAGADGFALQVDGSISGNGSARGIDATAVSIGGTGPQVVLEGGISVSGRITATTFDSTAIGILIAENAQVSSLDIQEGGGITTSISSTGDGASYGVRDLSGTLTSIRSNGFITANGSFEDTVVAIDLSANTSGVTITQYSPEDEDEDEEELVTTSITGDIRTGSGNDLIEVSDGEIRGDSFLGAGDDTVRLTGDAVYGGDISFGAGQGTLSIADEVSARGNLDFADQTGSVSITGAGSFRGTITGGARTSVNVQSGSFGADDADTIAFSNLTVGSDATIVVFIDSDAGENSLIDVGTATFASGSTIGAAVSSLDFVGGTYLVLTADTLTGSPTYGGEDTALPFLYTGQVQTDAAAGEIRLEIRRKTASELGLDPVLDNALGEILDAADADNSIEASLLAGETQEVLEAQLLGLTPEYSGGNFDLVTRASRAAAANLSDHDTMFTVSDTRIWLEGYGLSGKREVSTSGNYSLGGFGITGGYELGLGASRIGLTGNFFSGSNTNDDAVSATDVTAYELGIHWRHRFGDLLTYARGAAALVSMSRERTFEGYTDGGDDGNDDEDEDEDEDTPDFTRVSTSDSDGVLFSALAGAAYRAQLGSRLTVTPEVSVEYFRFDEKGYEEEGGGEAMDLVVEDRLSDAINVNTVVSLTYALAERRRDSLPFSISLAAGRRSNLSGTLGDTVANFEDGDAFTLPGRNLDDAWIGRVGVQGGGYDFKWFLTASGELESDQTTFDVRGGLGVAF